MGAGIKTGLTEIKRDDLDWIELSQERVCGHVLTQHARNSLTG